MSAFGAKRTLLTRDKARRIGVSPRLHGAVLELGKAVVGPANVAKLPAVAQGVGVNTDSALGPSSTDVVPAVIGIGYCADKIRRSRSQYPDTVGRL